MTALRDELRATKRSAVHLEMRDGYTPSDPTYQAWLNGQGIDVDAVFASWIRTVRDLVASGVVVRRARIVSEPVSDYIRFEHSVTSMNLAAGEHVRWLPRRRASDIALPGNDFWLLDDTVVRFGHFSGNGDVVGEEWSSDRDVAALCNAAFESVWERAVPHANFMI